MLRKRQPGGGLDMRFASNRWRDTSRISVLVLLNDIAYWYRSIPGVSDYILVLNEIKIVIHFMLDIKSKLSLGV